MDTNRFAVLYPKDSDDKDGVPAANKFFYVIATGRTYCFDDANGTPTTIINKVALKGADRYYWGHYLWQSQRGRHSSLYMIPDRYNDSYEVFFADIEKWVAADRDDYVYSFPAYDTTNKDWYVDYYGSNTKDAKALGLASSRFGWIFHNPAVEAGTPAIGYGVNPANALNYERGQYDAYQEFNAMKKVGFKCEAICSESPNYQNGSEYVTQGAKYTGTKQPALKIVAQPVSTSAAMGEEVSVSVEAKGEGLTYKWYFRDAGKANFSRSSITEATYTVEMTKTRADRELYCVITDALGNTVTTEIAKISCDQN